MNYRSRRLGIQRGSMVKCLARNPGILSSSRTRSLGFSWDCPSSARHIRGPSIVPVKPKKDINNVGCRCDMTVMRLKEVQNTIQPFNRARFP